MIAEGSSKLSSVPSGGAAAASSGGAAAAGGAGAAEEAKEEEKKAEEKVSVHLLLLTLCPLTICPITGGVRRRYGLRSFRLKCYDPYIMLALRCYSYCVNSVFVPGLDRV